MTTGRMSVPRWSWVGRVIAEPIRNRPLPHPRSRTTGASRPNSSLQFNRRSGIRLSAVCVHRAGSSTSPGNGTPNSRSVRRGGWSMVGRVGSLGEVVPSMILPPGTVVRSLRERSSNPLAERADYTGPTMPLLPPLTARDRRPEVMDQPGLDPAAHRRALDGLARLTAVSGAVRRLWDPIAELARANPGRPLRVLDVSTGGGEFPVTLADWARRAGLAIEAAGCV